MLLKLVEIIYPYDSVSSTEYIYLFIYLFKCACKHTDYTMTELIKLIVF